MKSIFVNGRICGKDWWNIGNETEIALRFGFLVKRNSWPIKARNEAKLALKKKGLSDSLKKIYNDIISAEVKQYKPITGATISTIVTQWYERELNKSIEIVDSDGSIIHKIK